MTKYMELKQALKAAKSEIARDHVLFQASYAVTAREITQKQIGRLFVLDYVLGRKEEGEK